MQQRVHHTMNLIADSSDRAGDALVCDRNDVALEDVGLEEKEQTEGKDQDWINDGSSKQEQREQGTDEGSRAVDEEDLGCANEHEDGTSASDFWTSCEMLAPDAIIPEERISELLAGDARAWNSFDLTMRSIKQIFKKVQHRLSQKQEPTSTARSAQEDSCRASDLEDAERVIASALEEHRVGVCAKALSRIMQRFGLQSWETMSLAQFAFIFRRLKLAQLFRAPDLATPARPGILNTMAYTPLQVLPSTVAWPLRPENMLDFFFKRQSALFGGSIDDADAHPVHWIHMHRLDPLLLLRLAVKYQLHPLSVEVSLSLSPPMAPHTHSPLVHVNTIKGPDTRSCIISYPHHLASYCALSLSSPPLSLLSLPPPRTPVLHLLAPALPSASLSLPTPPSLSLPLPPLPSPGRVADAAAALQDRAHRPRLFLRR